MKKKLLSFVLAILATLSFAACGGDDSSGTSTGGTNSASENSASDTSTVSAESEDDTSNGDTEVSQDGSVEFKLDITNTDELEMTDMTLETVSSNIAATGFLYFAYNSGEAEIKVYVDDVLVTKNDGVELIVGVEASKKAFVDNQAAKILVTADGTASVKVYENGDFSKDDTTVTTAVAGWEDEENECKGYVVTVKVPYELFGLDDETSIGNIAIAPALINDNGAQTVTTYTNLFGCDPTRMDGLVQIDEDGAYIVSEITYDTLRPVNAGNPEFGTWDVSKDYTEDDPNYANRIVTLVSNGTDTAFFNGVTGPVAYAEATFKINAIKNNDAWPKFGFLFDTGDQSGLFCFIDCATCDSTKTALTDIVNDYAGFVYVEETNYTWEATGTIDIPTGFKPETPIKLAVLRDGTTVKFYVNDNLTHTITNISTLSDDGECHIGISVFNLDIEVTDYRATDDENDAKIKELLGK